jgi:CheY-like chemotaxis protein
MTAYSNVLLVEDDPNDVFLVRRAFEKSKLSSVIHVAKDGEEAIAFLSGAGQYRDRKRFPLPVLVLLDLKLPRKSGFDVLDWLRREPVLKRLPVVILTSSREVKDIDKAYDVGANSYLVKAADPLGMADLTGIIDRYWMVLNQKPSLIPSPEHLHE